MRRFFGSECDFVCSLRTACARWQLTASPGCFLGQGATGRVFRVDVAGDRNPGALKIACGKDKARHLHRDFTAYTTLVYVP